MIKLGEAVIVEGKYDKIRLSSLIDALIISTEGFALFKDREKMAMIASLAKTRGIVILTDSDSAGFLIRSHILGCIKEGRVVNAYIPDISGKERRKTAPSKEGKLGVEGLDGELILNSLKMAGVMPRETKVFLPADNGEQEDFQKSRLITRQDLYDDGLFGGRDSKAKRTALLQLLGLPERLSVSALCEIINDAVTYEDYTTLIANNGQCDPQ